MTDPKKNDLKNLKRRIMSLPTSAMILVCMKRAIPTFVSGTYCLGSNVLPMEILR